MAAILSPNISCSSILNCSTAPLCSCSSILWFSSCLCASTLVSPPLLCQCLGKQGGGNWIKSQEQNHVDDRAALRQQMVRQLSGPEGRFAGGQQGRARGGLRALRFRQIHHDPLHQSPRGAPAGTDPG